MMSESKASRTLPVYEGRLRRHMLRVPPVIRECSGIVIMGKRIKSLVFTTDLCILRNIDADAVLAVYPFTPSPLSPKPCWPHRISRFSQASAAD